MRVAELVWMVSTKVRFDPVLQWILENPEPDHWFGPKWSGSGSEDISDLEILAIRRFGELPKFLKVVIYGFPTAKIKPQLSSVLVISSSLSFINRCISLELTRHLSSLHLSGHTSLGLSCLSMYVY